jgi:SAM-dependent methyltransferase
MDASAITELYAVGFYEKGAKRFRLTMADRIMRWFRKARAKKIHNLLPGPSRILDIGCGRGFTLAALQDRGHEVHGTQLSPEAAEFARNCLSLEHIEQRDLLEIGYPDGWFDAITIYHVLEHVHDPLVMVREIARILRPGGRLIVEVPHAGGAGARVLKRYWLGWDVPYHRFHFTQATLERVLAEFGLTAVSWSFPTIEYAPVVLIQSVLNALTGSENLLFRSLSYTSKGGSRLGGLRMGLELILALLIALPCAILAIIGSVCRRGEIISVQCRKVFPREDHR